MPATDPPLPGQYHATRRDVETSPPGFDRITVGDWTVVFDESFRAARVVADGEAVGRVVGTVLDVGARTRSGAVRVDGPVAPTADLLRRTADRLLGRYVGFLRVDGGVRVLTDPLGALPAVFDEDREVVAASPLSIPGVSHGEHFRGDLHGAAGEPGDRWLPGTTTYYAGVRRLLPNHALDVGTWEVARFWPGDPADVEPGADPDPPARRVAGGLEDAVEAIAACYDAPKLALTAGMDSRCLLAVARPWVTDGTIRLYTFEGEEYRRDLHIARAIAEDHDLDWRPLPVTLATDAERERFTRRTGHAVGTAVTDVFPTMRDLGADARIEGLGGEIGRGFYWRGPDDDGPADGADLLERFGKPQLPELVDELDRWLDGVEAFAAPATLDLAYQEQRLGPWAGPQHLGLPTELDYLCPFSYPPVIQSMHRLPADLRASEGLPGRLIDATWPELHDYPFNAYTGWRRWRNAWARTRPVRLGLANPGDALRYVVREYL